MSVRRKGEFARLLRHYRQAAGLTQRELALRAGVGERTVSDLERGVAVEPYEDTVRRLAGALQLTEVSLSAFRSAARPGSEAGTGVPMVRRLAAASGNHLVGREAELMRMQQLLAEVDGKAGHVVLVTGEAGVGKTRLVLETCRTAVDRDHLVAFGRCYDTQQGVPFTPFVEVLSAVYFGGPADLRATAADRWPQLLRLLPDEVSEPSQLPSVGAAEVSWLFRTVTSFLRAAAGERPVVLVLEDLHWADAVSLNLLLHLARATRADPIAIIGTLRDVEVGRAHPLRAVLRELDREETTDRVRLRPLSLSETAALVRASWTSELPPPPSLEAQVYRRTDGNPFFVVETLADLMERRALPASEDIVLRAPDTVTEAILGRVSRLAPATKQVLTVASVLGPGEVEDLLAVAGPDDEQTELALEQAEDSGLLRTVGSEFAFDHSLTQEALYADLTTAGRRRLHLQVGAGLEGRGERTRRERAADIARHFLFGGAPDRALPHCVQAGRRAEAVFAYAEAEQHYREALDLVQGSDRSVEAGIWRRLGAVLTGQARYDDALVALERAGAEFRAAAADAEVDRTEADIAMTHFRSGEPALGIVRVTYHLAGLPTSSRPDPGPADERRDALAALQLALARLYYADGRYRDCRDAGERGASLCRPDDDARLLAEIELWRGIGLLWSDAPDGGVIALTHALALAEGHRLLDVIGTACLPLHLAYALRGEFGPSRQFAERGMAAAERTGDLALLAMHTANRGMQQVYSGDWLEAEADLTQAVGIAGELATSYFSPLPAAYLGVLRLAQGRLDEAGDRLLEALDRAREAGNREVHGYARTQLLRLDLQQGRPETVVERLGGQPDLSGVTWWYDVILLTVLASALLAMDRPVEAEAVADSAVARARRMRNRVDGASALDVRAATRHRLGRHQEAAQDRAEAVAWRPGSLRE